MASSTVVFGRLHASLDADAAPAICSAGGGLLALNRGGGTVSVWDLEGIDGPPLLLAADDADGSGSPTPLLALAPVDGADTTLLAAASAVSVQVWPLRRRPGAAAPEPAAGTSAVAVDELAESAGAFEVHALAFEPGGKRLVVLAACEAWVFGCALGERAAELRLELRLVGHASPLSCATFGGGKFGGHALIGAPASLLTASEDRCFKLWALPPAGGAAGEEEEEARLVMESSLSVGGGAILSVAMVRARAFCPCP